MQDHRNGGTASAPSRRAVPPPRVDRVSGLGVCDALRVELDRCQIESFRDEIDELRRVIDDSIRVTTDRGDDGELHRLGYETEVLGMIARQLAEALGTEAVVVVGPARVMSELVGGATRDAAERLVDELGQRPPRDGSPGALTRAAGLTSEWVRTYVALRAVESYSFDPDFDPLGR